MPQLVDPAWQARRRCLRKSSQFKWAGLRCRVKVDGRLRRLHGRPPRQARRPGPRWPEAKAVGKDGTVALVVDGRQPRGDGDDAGPARSGGQRRREDAGDGGGINGRRWNSIDLDQHRRRGLRRVHRPQGPGAQVRPPVPGADLRLRVPARPLLRQHRRGGDPGRACRSSSGSFATGRCAAARRNCSRPAPARPGSVKIIDIISARLDAKTDSYLATLPSLQLKDVGIEDKLVSENERMLTGGFYAEVDLSYDAVDRPGEERPAVLDRRPAADPALEARRAGRPVRGTDAVHDRRVEALPAPQHRPGADRA